jgi:hypothetical protein
LSEPQILLPNLGGEEPGAWQRALREPRVASAARTWQYLFPARARLIESCEALAAGPSDWPASLPGDRETAALPWLDDLTGCVPWIATPAAHLEAEASGTPLSGPPGSVVARVHDKAFALRTAEEAGLVPRPLSGCALVFDPDELADSDRVCFAIERQVDGWPDWARRAATLKPRLGTSGRGRLDFGRAGPGRELLARALPGLAERGGAILEPWLDRSRDLSVQLRIADSGEVFVMGTLEMLVGASGGWRGHRGEVDSRGRVFSGLAEEEPLREAGALMASAAARAGFHGPAGVDALVFRLADGGDDREILRPVVELNARFTMGAVTIGLVRRALDQACERLGLEPGERRSFVFLADEPATSWSAAAQAAGSDGLLVPLWREGDPTRQGLLFARSSAIIDLAVPNLGCPPATEPQP